MGRLGDVLDSQEWKMTDSEIQDALYRLDDVDGTGYMSVIDAFNGHDHDDWCDVEMFRSRLVELLEQASDDGTERRGWLRAPTYPDGGPMFVGDIVDVCLDDCPTTRRRIEYLRYGADGWEVEMDDCYDSYPISDVRRHRTTVEELLADMLADSRRDGLFTDASLVGEYASMIREVVGHGAEGE